MMMMMIWQIRSRIPTICRVESGSLDFRVIATDYLSLFRTFYFLVWLHPVWSTAMSFDLYAKYGNNRTLSLVSPKKPYYQWRLRVPSGHVVRLDVVTLQGATPGSCSANKLSAYDFLLPLQNKIIARCVCVRFQFNWGSRYNSALKSNHII